MKITSSTPDSVESSSIIPVESTTPSQGISNVSQQDNSPINMNTPEPKTRGSRASDLVDTMAMDNYDLQAEAPRHTKMTG